MFVRLFVCSFVCLFVRSFVRLFVCLLAGCETKMGEIQEKLVAYCNHLNITIVSNSLSRNDWPERQPSTVGVWWRWNQMIDHDMPKRHLAEGPIVGSYTNQSQMKYPPCFETWTFAFLQHEKESFKKHVFDLIQTGNEDFAQCNWKRATTELRLTHLMASGGRILLVAVEHDGFGQKKGPPFQVLCSGYKTQGTQGMIAEVLVQMVVECRLRCFTIMSLGWELRSRWLKLMCWDLRTRYCACDSVYVLWPDHKALSLQQHSTYTCQSSSTTKSEANKIS